MIILGFHARCSLWPGLLQFQALSQYSTVSSKVARQPSNDALEQSGLLGRAERAALRGCAEPLPPACAGQPGGDAGPGRPEPCAQPHPGACEGGLPAAASGRAGARALPPEGVPAAPGLAPAVPRHPVLQRPGRDTHTPACLHAACMFQCVPLVLHAPMLVKCCPEARNPCLRVCVRRRAAVCAAPAAAITPSTWSTG